MPNNTQHMRYMQLQEGVTAAVPAPVVQNYVLADMPLLQRRVRAGARQCSTTSQC